TRAPVDGERVEVVREGPALRVLVRPADARAARVAGAVDGAVHEVRLVADVLHDVDLARARPGHLGEPRAEHPEGRPDPLAAGDLDPRLDAAVPELVPVLRRHPGRGVRAVGLPPGGDDQVPLTVEGRV